MKPTIKSYNDIVQTTANLFGITYEEANKIVVKKLSHLRLTKLSIVLYVNYTSHNALTYKELAKALGITVARVKVELRKLNRKFPHLFQFGTHPRDCATNWEMNKISLDDLEAFHGYEDVKAKRTF